MPITVRSPRRSSIPVGGGVAIFDLDRTLIPGSSLVPLGRELIRRGLVRRRVLVRNAAAGVAFQRRGLVDSSIDRVERRLLATLAGEERQPLVDAASDVGRDLGAQVSDLGRFLVDCHRVGGDFCVLLTAAPQELADAVAAALGMHRAVGTRLGVDGDRFDGTIDGVRCHGPGKLDRLDEEVGDVSWDVVSAYGDSLSDLPVLERAGRPTAVNPDKGLRAVAEERGWPTLWLR